MAWSREHSSWGREAGKLRRFLEVGMRKWEGGRSTSFEERPGGLETEGGNKLNSEVGMRKVEKEKLKS